MKVAVLGAAGGIGQALALLLKNPTAFRLRTLPVRYCSGNPRRGG
jgi:lactate/malate dehydrogenase, NAD binding domain.